MGFICPLQYVQVTPHARLRDTVYRCVWSMLPVAGADSQFVELVDLTCAVYSTEDIAGGQMQWDRSGRGNQLEHQYYVVVQMVSAAWGCMADYLRIVDCLIPYFHTGADYDLFL